MGLGLTSKVSPSTRTMTILIVMIIILIVTMMVIIVIVVIIFLILRMGQCWASVDCDVRYVMFVWIKNIGYCWQNLTWCCNVDCYLCRKGRGKESVSAFFTDQWMAEGCQAKGTEKVREKNVYEYKWDKVLRIEIQSCSQLYYILGNLLDREYKKVEKASFTGQWSRIRKKFNQSGRRILCGFFLHVASSLPFILFPFNWYACLASKWSWIQKELGKRFVVLFPDHNFPPICTI